MTSRRHIAALFLPKRTTRAAGHSPPAAESADVEELWAVIARIPYGVATTYGAIARAAGLPGRARLAGRALRVAHDAMNLPWHRVVGAGGRIAFPRTSRHCREQTRRLRAEGVTVTNGRVAAAFMTELD